MAAVPSIRLIAALDLPSDIVGQVPSIASPLATVPATPDQASSSGIADIQAIAARRYFPLAGQSVPDLAAAPATQPIIGRGDVLPIADNGVTNAVDPALGRLQSSPKAAPIAGRSVQPSSKTVQPLSMTADQLLTQINDAQQRGGRIDFADMDPRLAGPNQLPQGVTGYLSVVADENDPGFKFDPSKGAVFTSGGVRSGTSPIRAQPIAGFGAVEAAKRAGEAPPNQIDFTSPRPQPIGSMPQGPAVGSVEYFLNMIDPTVRALAPMRALNVAGERADKYAAQQLARQELEMNGGLRTAQTNYHNAHADLLRLQASPGYLQRQEQNRLFTESLQERRDIAVRLREAQRSYATAMKSGDPDQIAGATDLIAALNEDAQAVGVKPMPVPGRPITSEEESALKTQAIENLKAKRGTMGRFFNTSPSVAEINVEVQRLKSESKPLNRVQSAWLERAERKLSEGATLSASDEALLRKLSDRQAGLQAGNDSYTAQRNAFIRSQAENPDQYISQLDGRQPPAGAAMTQPQPQQAGKAMLSGNSVVMDGQSYPLNQDGTVTIGGRKYRVQ